MYKAQLTLLASLLMLTACGGQAEAEAPAGGNAVANANLIVSITGVEGSGTQASCDINTTAVNTSDSKLFGIMMNFRAVHASTGAELPVGNGLIPIGTLEAGTSKDWPAAGVVTGAACKDVMLTITEQHCSPRKTCAVAYKAEGIAGLQPLAAP